MSRSNSSTTKGSSCAPRGMPRMPAQTKRNRQALWQISTRALCLFKVHDGDLLLYHSLNVSLSICRTSMHLIRPI